VSNASWDDLQLMLCAPRVLGYVLKDKQWAQLAVTKLSDVEKEDAKAVLNTLHLVGRENGISKKNLLMALVRNHGKVMVKDIVAGKGEGLVFLLYGEPGVGKTSTGK
jgi:ATP-dependent Lon protease